MKSRDALIHDPEHRAPIETGESLADDTLVSLLEADRVPMQTLHDRYGPLLGLVEVLIGVVPDCDPYLEIWPPAFRTYNIMVPNFLNLPLTLFGFGGVPKDLVGLGMYVASQTAECGYCSAHTCSFALRRGTALETMIDALQPDKTRSPREEATIAVARALARIPCELSVAQREAFEAHLGPVASEWTMLGIVMMGFLNKFMDTVGVELERSTQAEVSQVLGKSSRSRPTLPPTPPPSADTLWTKIRAIPKLPVAFMLDAGWLRGVPGTWPAIGTFLIEHTGHDFSVLSHLRQARVIRAIGAMLRENLDPDTTKLGLDLKVLAGIVFATIAENESLVADVRALGSRQGVSAEAMDAVRAFASDPGAPPPKAASKAQTTLLLARAAAYSPARITSSLVARCREVQLSPPEIVELVSWLSVLQMLHRLTSYFKAV